MSEKLKVSMFDLPELPMMQRKHRSAENIGVESRA
jgi:hypothetical protein